jgi:hypothetical protein
MANSSIILTNLDFETQKNTLKQYLRSQDRFKDYDFDGSNMNVLLDVLSYNTYLNTFYLNMVGNEMFLDTAQMRDSIISHAKELNYTPRSFNSAEANVNIVFTSTNVNKRSIFVPKGTTFTSRSGIRNFTFSTSENLIVSDVVANATAAVFTASNVTLYEGDYVNDSFTVNPGQNARYLLTNKNVDTSSVRVTVIEDLGATVLSYNKASSLFGLTAESKVFFIQGAENSAYEIVFGDNITAGRAPKDNSVVLVEYRISSGELPNGCTVFKPDGAVDGETNITITTNTKALGGSVSESVESIRFNAPRHFSTQERAVTTEDYQTLLQIQFPEINAVTAYGGEEADPPQYGKVFVSVDLKDVDGLPDVKRVEYYKFLKPRSPVSIDPVFVNPDYMYIYVQSVIKYNINLTSLNSDDIRTLAISAIINYANAFLNNFNRTIRYSKFINYIDSAHASIVSNETIVKAVRYITPKVGISQNIVVDFKLPLVSRSPDITINQGTAEHCLESSVFTYQGKLAYLQDDGLGTVSIFASTSLSKIIDIGTIDYTTGGVNLTNLNIDSYTGPLKIYVSAKSDDISSSKNTILNINEYDVFVTVQQVRE